MDKEKIFDLNQLREDYIVLTKKYKLPEFEQLAEDFDIEKASEKETLFILRSIRRAINEKISGYLHLFETLMNPTSAPMLILLMLKNSDEQSRKEIEETYKKIAKIEIISIKLDTIYSEKKEAEYISYVYTEWQKMKQPLYDLIEKCESNFDISIKSDKKAYFG